MTLNKDEEVQILKNLISINTINGNEAKVANYLKKLFDKYEIKNKIIPQLDGRDNLIAEIGDGNGKKIAFSGHEDTVDVGDNWDSDPTTPTIKGDKLFGRGTTDMKSGLAAFAITVINLSKENLHGTLRFIATISEEVNQGGADYLSNHLDYVSDLDSIVIGEGTSIDSTTNPQKYIENSRGIENQDKGVLLNRLKNNQSFKQNFIENTHTGNLIYTVISKGKAVHSSTPELGISAIDNLIDYRLEEGKLFKEICQTKDNQLGPTIYTPDIFKGGEQVNTIPDYAYQRVMVRTIPEVPNDDIIKKLKKLIDRLNQKDGYDLSLEITFNGNPVKSPTDSKLIKLFKQHAKDVFPDDPINLPTRAATGGSDDSMFTAHNPNINVLIVGPGNTTAHMDNEYVSLDSYHRIIKLYQSVAKNYLNS